MALNIWPHLSTAKHVLITFCSSIYLYSDSPNYRITSDGRDCCICEFMIYLGPSGCCFSWKYVTRLLSLTRIASCDPPSPTARWVTMRTQSGHFDLLIKKEGSKHSLWCKIAGKHFSVTIYDLCCYDTSWSFRYVLRWSTWLNTVSSLIVWAKMWHFVRPYSLQMTRFGFSSKRLYTWVCSVTSVGY